MEVFFYGLFMDFDVLKSKSVYPSNSRKAYLDNYQIKIGARASLVPCNGEKSYGVVMTLGKDDVDRLYADNSVADYKPKLVNVITESNESLTATCYLLPPDMLAGKNAEYAQTLYELAKRLNFPEDYLIEIKSASGK